MATSSQSAPTVSGDGCLNYGLQALMIAEDWSNALPITQPLSHIPNGALDTELAAFDNLLRSGDPLNFGFGLNCQSSNQSSSPDISAESEWSEKSSQITSPHPTPAQASVARGARHHRHTLASFERTSAVEEISLTSAREKNRIAASKCRKKKRLEERDLDEKRRSLQLQNVILKETVTSLREEVLFLKNEILKHGICDYPPIQDYISTAALQIHGFSPDS